MTTSTPPSGGIALTDRQIGEMRRNRRDGSPPRDRELNQWMLWLAYAMLVTAVFVTLFILCPPMIAGLMPGWVVYLFGTAFFTAGLAYVERRVKMNHKDSWAILRTSHGKEILLLIAAALLAAALTLILFHAGALLAPTMLGAAVYWKVLTAASFAAVVLGAGLIVYASRMSLNHESARFKLVMLILLAAALIASICIFAAPGMMALLGAQVALSGFAYTTMQLVAIGGAITGVAMIPVVAAAVFLVSVVGSSTQSNRPIRKSSPPSLRGGHRGGPFRPMDGPIHGFGGGPGDLPPAAPAVFVAGQTWGGPSTDVFSFPPGSSLPPGSDAEAIARDQGISVEELRRRTEAGMAQGVDLAQQWLGDEGPSHAADAARLAGGLIHSMFTTGPGQSHGCHDGSSATMPPG